MIKSTRVLTCLLVAALATACTPPAAEDPAASLPSAGTINGQSVPQAAVDAFLAARFRKPTDQLTDSEIEQGKDDFVQLVLLARAAKSQGLEAEPEVAGQLMVQEMNLLAQNLLSRRNDTDPVTDELVQAAYEERLNDGSAREYKARHILLETEDAAKAVIAKLDEGANFEELAKTESTGPSGPNGGDLGWFGEGRMVAPFWEATIGLEAGNYSPEPVQTQFGWHVILLEQTRDRPFAQAAPQLRAQMQREQIENYINELKESAQVSWNP